MNGQIAGTSIQDLHQNEKREHYENLRKLNHTQQAQYGSMQNMQAEQGHNVSHQSHQDQHIPYYNVEENHDYPQWMPQDSAQTAPGQTMPQNMPQNMSQTIPQNISQRMPQRMQQRMPYISDEETNIEDLARDLNSTLSIENYSDKSVPGKEQKVRMNKSNGGLLSRVPSILREPLILVTLYVILSQPVVKDTIARYIPQINSGMYGDVPFTGVLIYGLILATLYVVIKKLLMKQ